ncbi:hypothetical protein SAMN02800687_0692 [Curtobacterium sp. UNCCL20]|nr:hypothetical protein SAMN02800687_0692 [Curtobacterium sp. UNCCL20]
MIGQTGAALTNRRMPASVIAVRMASVSVSVTRDSAAFAGPATSIDPNMAAMAAATRAVRPGVVVNNFVAVLPFRAAVLGN